MCIKHANKDAVWSYDMFTQCHTIGLHGTCVVAAHAENYCLVLFINLNCMMRQYKYGISKY